eukprot:1904620-Pleurochrysis_carterae.AAC.1
MAHGRTVVLVNHDNVYEALYDLLNQRYLIKRDANGVAQRLLRLAIGSRSQLCVVHEAFKLVVVVEAAHAWARLDLPLLNRFEKQVMTAKEVLSRAQTAEATALADFVAHVRSECEVDDLTKLFAGFHEAMLASLVLCHWARDETEEQETVEEEAEAGAEMREAASNGISDTIVAGDAMGDAHAIAARTQQPPSSSAAVASASPSPSSSSPSPSSSSSAAAVARRSASERRLRTMRSQLAHIATPLAVWHSKTLQQLAHANRYFELHADLPAALNYRLCAPLEPHDAQRRLFLFATQSPLEHAHVALESVQAAALHLRVSMTQLARFGTEAQLVSEIDEFLKPDNVHGAKATDTRRKVLILQCDPVRSGRDLLNHTMHICRQRCAISTQSDAALLILLHLPPGTAHATREIALDFNEK